MKDLNQQELESSRPEKDVLICIDWCLKALYADPTKEISDAVAKNLTYEEVLGTLLLARDAIEAARAAKAAND